MANTILLCIILLIVFIIMCQQFYYNSYRKMMDDIIEKRLREIAKGQHNIWMQAISNNLPQMMDEIKATHTTTSYGKDIKNHNHD